MRLIIIRLNGGLGNQMFQYAAGLGIAAARGLELRIDTSAFDTPDGMAGGRAFSLGDFQLSAPVLEATAAVRARNPLGIVSRIQRQLQRRMRGHHYEDWHPELLGQMGAQYLEGYFQSERYFVDIAEWVRHEFRLRDDLEASMPAIGAATPVSIHIRRGDYASDPATAAIYDICQPEYFERAMAYVSERDPSSTFVVFSDSPEWVREFVRLPPGTTFASDGSLCPSQELVLMSRCHHHIIANSTFSWWGAWLNPKPGKIVIAPQRWTSTPGQHPNIAPPDWIRLAN